MSYSIEIGTTDYTKTFFILDSAQTDGSGKTGLVAANLTVSYTRVETDNDVVVTDVTSSLNDLGTLTTAHTDWGIKEVSNTLAPGLYRIDFADAVFASGAWTAVVNIMVTTSAAAATPIEFVLENTASIQDIVDGVWDELGEDHEIAGSFGALVALASTAAALVTTLSNLVTSFFRLALAKATGIATDEAAALALINADGGSGGGTYVSTTDSLEANRDNIGTAGAGLTAADDAVVTLVNDLPTNAELATALGTADDAVLVQIALIKTQTDKLTFTVANVIDANVQRINDVALVGDGDGTPFNV